MTDFRDRREEIIERLVAILSGLTIELAGGKNGPSTISPGNFVHNRNELPSGKVPGVILLDADEVKDPRSTLPPRGQVEGQVPPQVMKMTPEIYVVLDVRKPDNENVGEDLNTARREILAAILPDSELQALTGSNGGICYDAAVTDLARNRMMQGQMGMSITFSYPLMPREIVGV